MNIEEATEFIYKTLNYAYCDNCRGNDDKDHECDECHRKMQNWAIRKCTAEGIAKKILQDTTEA